MVPIRALLIGAALACAAPLGCSTCDRKAATSTAAPLTQARARADEGFSALNASHDTLKVYVSSAGDDANSGLASEAPLRTIGAGLAKLRDGHADWLLFKRGDHWDQGLPNWNLSGRSATEPMIVGAYGTGARPEFRTGNEPGIGAIGSGGAAERHDHVWFVGLEFYSNTRDPKDPSFDKNPPANTGILWLRGTSDLLVEDCVLRFYGDAVVLQDSGKAGLSGVRLRRNQFLDSYSTESAGHSQGVYIEGATGVVLEENTFDHNGWNESVAGAQPTIFNHNLYVQNGNKNIVLKHNIFLRASSHGVQLRSGGIADGNLFAYNAISLLIGGGNEPEPGGISGELKDNVILLGVDIGAEPRAYGISLENVRAVTVANNIVANAKSASADGVAIQADVRGAKYASNIVYNWPQGKNKRGSYRDPARDLASYDAALGGPGTFEHFVHELRAQSQQNWRMQYTAQAIGDYIRDGLRESN